MTTIAPYGSWRSPITVDLLTAGQVGLGGGAIDGDALYWTESRATEGGRTSLWREDADGRRTELTPKHYVRDMVHEYGGGGSWAVSDGVVVFSTFPDHTVHVLADGELRQLAPGGALRYAAFDVHPARNLVLCVREDHTESDLECRNEIVALRLDSDNPDGGTVVVTGADFYATPRLSETGELAWVEWDHPHMPWDSTRLMRAHLQPDLGLDQVAHVAGIDGMEQVGGDSDATASAPCYPTWHGPDLYFLNDATGYWNLRVQRDGVIESLHAVDDEHDYCFPAWVPSQPFTVLGDGRVLCRRFVDGNEEVGLLAEGAFTPLGWESVSHSVAAAGSRVLAHCAYPDRAPELVVCDLATGERRVLRTAVELNADLMAYVPKPEPVTWDGPQGPVHAFLYLPRNPDFAAPDDELPPLKVLSHGGPTSLSYGTLDLGKAYWTSRGWAILDVNYGGSAGYGRAYRERLQGTWGIVDVADCADGARAMIERGVVDPRRIAIEGGSAGGYTTLQALVSCEVFTAGNSRYGIGDLRALARDTHKFESRYLEGLLGGSPEQVPDVYADRSPVNHLDRLAVPMLIQQGAEDRVVPASQAEQMADAVRAKGLPVALLMFAGEGHGFRRAENIRASLEGANSFFGQVFGYEPDGVERLPVENLGG